jgi:uncharacterized YigZ family protein
MQTITEQSTATYEVKKSTFHAFLVPFVDFETTLLQLKSDHPKARHIVWAYRTLNEHGQIVENQTDDGEPKGTSGPPVLNVLRGVNLVEVAVLIVRYFGGVKLGTGGLVRAYSSAVNAAINQAKIILYEPKTKLGFYTPYTLVQRIEYWVEREALEVASRNFDATGVRWELTLSAIQATALKDYVRGLEREGLVWL